MFAKMRGSGNSLTGKLVRFSVILLALGLILNGYVQYSRSAREASAQLGKTTDAVAGILAQTLPALDRPGPIDGLDGLLRAMHVDTSIAFARLLSNDGKTLAVELNSASPRVVDVPLEISPRPMQTAVGALQKNDAVVVRRYPVRRQGRVTGFLEVGVDTSVVGRKLRTDLMTYAAISALTVLAVMAALLWGLRRYAMTPLRRLDRSLRRISAGDLSQPVNISSEDEFGQLARHVNTMMDSLRQSSAEKERAMEQLKELNHTLEARVHKRTHELHAVNEQLQRLAKHDSLTNLPNRFFIQERLQDCIDDARRHETSFCILMMDLDRFKEVNDTLGHDSGDELLVQVGVRIEAMLRDTDTAGRLGGDEFAVILPATDAKGALRVAEKILQALEPPFYLRDMAFSISASVGVAVFPEHGTDISSMLKSADVAMYNAKASTEGILVYHPDEDSNTPDRLTFMGELRQAIHQNHLELYYQPKVDLHSQQVIGVEALVRWQHPDKGTIGPDLFIPIAEQTGLIRPLTYWVMDTAFGCARQWQQEGLDISIAINLSMYNIQDANFIDTLAELLTKWRVKPSRVVFEITESMIMSNPVYALQVLNEMSRLGVRLAVDDFGTGYSSLSQLRSLPVDELKIDRSFVMNMSEDSDEQAIVRSIIDMAQNMGLNVVAEGVESHVVIKQLMQLGCDQVQGYYISRPLPLQQLTAFLENLHWPVDTDTVRRLSS